MSGDDDERLGRKLDSILGHIRANPDRRPLPAPVPTAARPFRPIPEPYAAAHTHQLADLPEYQHLLDWANTFTSKRLVLVGPTGAGKTWAAAALANLVQRPTWWAHVPTLLAELRPEGGATLPATLTQLRRSTMVVFDDLGQAQPSDWVFEELGILAEAVAPLAKVIVTTNLGPQELVDRVGERVYSRLCAGAARARLTGADRRGG